MKFSVIVITPLNNLLSQLPPQLSHSHLKAKPYLIHILKGVDDVVRQARQQVYDKPGLQVVHADEFWVRNHLSTRTHEGGVEVEDDVHQEDYINHAIQHQPNNVVLLGFEGNIVGHHYGCVKGKDKDDPVPGGLEGAVVKNYVGRRLGSFLLVLWEDVRVELQNLETGNRKKV